MLVKVYTDASTQSSDSFNFPIWLCLENLRKAGVRVNFDFSQPHVASGADVAFINSHIFRDHWQREGGKNQIFKFLEELKAKTSKIVWFDTTDSTWCTQLGVLPIVDKFLKNQIFKDKALYMRGFRGGRIFTEYFSSLYDIDEENLGYSCPSHDDLKKIGISWNSSLYNFGSMRNSLASKLLKNVSCSLKYKFESHFLTSFISPETSRSIDVSARLNFKYNRRTVSVHRTRVSEALKKIGCSCSAIPAKEYFEELRRSKIVVSPFGLGEICYRDYEAIWSGAALVKPSMSHLGTWPELYEDGATYISHSWDLSDLLQKVEETLSSPELRIRIAKTGQLEYMSHFSEEGISNFAKRIVSFIEE